VPDAQRTAPERLARLPSWLLTHVANRSHQLVLEAVGTPERRSFYAVLACLAEFGALSQIELSRRTGIDTADLVGLLRRMEDEGLVGRAPDARDRRRNMVTPTGAGGAELRRLDALLERAQEQLLEPLDGERRAALLDTLRRLLDHHSELGRPMPTQPPAD
jgi:DNA-binding MarR family transcriptional regulator